MSCWAVLDLGFGDAGKGTITDFLVRRFGVGLVVRFNGGAQAGHNVVTPDGRHHTFAQFGSGSFVPGVRTLLGPEFLLHPLGMMVEEQHLRSVGVHDAWQRTQVDRGARVITPYHQAMNRLLESQRGEHRHGSCGVGVGPCVSDSLQHPNDVIRAGELGIESVLNQKLRTQQQRCLAAIEDLGCDAPGIFTDPGLIPRVIAIWQQVASLLQCVEAAPIVAEAPSIVFEGAQGVLLDEWWGFHPYTTWSDCTFGGVGRLCSRPFHRLGVLRSYGVRHGPGPFPGEGQLELTEEHNQHNPWQRGVRTGAFDAVLLRYALEVCGGVDSLALTCLDRVEVGPVVRSYGGVERLDPGEKRDLSHREKLGGWMQRVEAVVEALDVRSVVEEQVAVSVLSRGSRASHKAVVGSVLEGPC